MRVTLCDVGPRDGLQNEPETLAPEVRGELVRRLSAAGLPRVEAASFVSDERVPQMAGAEEVVAAAGDVQAELSGLVLNERGWERLAATSLDRVNVTLAATESFNQRNGNASLEEATARVERILAVADRPSTATISVAFGCPFEGEVDPGVVADLAERLVAAGAGEVVLADTIGVATPRPVQRLVERTSILGIPDRRPLPRHAPHRRRQRLGGGRGRCDSARRFGRRPRRLPVRAARDGQRRHRGRPLSPRPRARRDGRRSRGADRRGEVAGRAARPRATRAASTERPFPAK